MPCITKVERSRWRCFVEAMVLMDLGRLSAFVFGATMLPPRWLGNRVVCCNIMTFHFTFLRLIPIPTLSQGLLTGGLAIVHMQIGMKWVVCPATLPGQLAAGNMPAGSCQQQGLSVFVILRTHTWEFFLTFALYFSFRPLHPALPPLWLTSTNLHPSSAHLRSFSQRLSLMAFCLLIPPRALCRL